MPVPGRPARAGNPTAGWASYDRLRPGERITHTEALVNRLERLFAPPIIRGIIGCPRTTVPFDEVLGGQTMLIVSLPSDRLSPERCDFLGALLLCALADRVFARTATAAPSRLHIYLDEYQRFATSTTAELLTQGRKYGAGVTLAHQDLHQIRDLRIRNASRHAGTLIVLGVTRPDAEQLAGEFPVEPRPEEIETIEDVDGTEPVYVFSPTPAEDIFLEGHPDPEVDLAARSFLAPVEPLMYTETELKPQYEDKIVLGRRVQVEAGVRAVNRHIPVNDKRKSAGRRARPGGIDVHPKAQMEPPLNGLLFDAMEGKVASAEDFTAKLIEHRIFFDFANRSPSLEPGPSEQLDLAVYQARADATWKAFEQERERFLQHALRPWRLVYANDPEALRAGKSTDAFRKADGILSSTAVWWSWTDVFTWQGCVEKQLECTLSRSGRTFLSPLDS